MEQKKLYTFRESEEEELDEEEERNFWKEVAEEEDLDVKDLDQEIDYTALIEKVGQTLALWPWGIPSQGPRR